MSDWLDSWTKVRRRPKTLDAAHRFATRQSHAADEINGTIPSGYHYTLDDTRYILAHGKRAWREHKFGAAVIRG